MIYIYTTYINHYHLDTKSVTPHKPSGLVLKSTMQMTKPQTKYRMQPDKMCFFACFFSDVFFVDILG